MEGDDRWTKLRIGTNRKWATTHHVTVLLAIFSIKPGLTPNSIILASFTYPELSLDMSLSPCGLFIPLKLLVAPLVSLPLSHNTKKSLQSFFVTAQRSAPTAHRSPVSHVLLSPSRISRSLPARPSGPIGRRDA